MIRVPKDYKIITNLDDSESDKVFQEICNIISEMCRNGVIFLGNGYCISMSDMIKTALLQKKINSRLVEATCTISRKIQGNDDLVFIGFDEGAPGQIDSHVVLITETYPSYLVDASIQRFLPDNYVAVVSRISNNDKDVLSNIEDVNNETVITHIEKPLSKIPLSHHQSITNRIAMDQKISRDINLLKKLNYIGITLSIFAVIAVINQIFRWFV